MSAKHSHGDLAFPFYEAAGYTKEVEGMESRKQGLRWESTVGNCKNEEEDPDVSCQSLSGLGRKVPVGITFPGKDSNIISRTHLDIEKSKKLRNIDSG